MDIKDKLQLEIIIDLVPVETCACVISLNDDIIFADSVQQRVQFTRNIGLNDPIKLWITTSRRHPQAIILNDISVDGISIIPIYRSIAVPPTNYLDKNETWKLEIPNFYQWYHAISGKGWIA